MIHPRSSLGQVLSHYLQLFINTELILLCHNLLSVMDQQIPQLMKLLLNVHAQDQFHSTRAPADSVQSMSFTDRADGGWEPVNWVGEGSAASQKINVIRCTTESWALFAGYVVAIGGYKLYVVTKGISYPP